MSKHLFFDYASTAKIRFKISNCYESTDFPLIYRIMTEKLDFYIPKKMTILTKKYIYIPFDYYRLVLAKYYLTVSKINLVVS